MWLDGHVRPHPGPFARRYPDFSQQANISASALSLPELLEYYEQVATPTPRPSQPAPHAEIDIEPADHDVRVAVPTRTPGANVDDDVPGPAAPVSAGPAMAERERPRFDSVASLPEVGGGSSAQLAASPSRPFAFDERDYGLKPSSSQALKPVPRKPRFFAGDDDE